jgi:hypothetical protein
MSLSSCTSLLFLECMLILFVDGPEKPFTVLSSTAFHFFECASRGQVVANGVLDQYAEMRQFIDQ